MPRLKGSLNKNKITEETEEAVIENIAVEEPVSIPYVNEELAKLQKLHSQMLENGIKDIGQLEVIISKLQ